MSRPRPASLLLALFMVVGSCLPATPVAAGQILESAKRRSARWHRRDVRKPFGRLACARVVGLCLLLAAAVGGCERPGGGSGGGPTAPTNPTNPTPPTADGCGQLDKLELEYVFQFSFSTSGDRQMHVTLSNSCSFPIQVLLSYSVFINGRRTQTFQLSHPLLANDTFLWGPFALTSTLGARRSDDVEVKVLYISCSPEERCIFPDFPTAGD